MKKIFYFIFIAVLIYQSTWCIQTACTEATHTADDDLATLLPQDELRKLKKTNRFTNLLRLRTQKADMQNKITFGNLIWVLNHDDLIYPALPLKDINDTTSSYEKSLNLGNRPKRAKKHKIFELLDKNQEGAAQLSQDIYECLLAETIKNEIGLLPNNSDYFLTLSAYAEKHHVSHLANICRRLPENYTSETAIDEIEDTLRDIYTKYLLNILKENRSDSSTSIILCDLVEEDTQE
jgi:hypothetical protein